MTNQWTFRATTVMFAALSLLPSCLDQRHLIGETPLPDGGGSGGTAVGGNPPMGGYGGTVLGGGGGGSSGGSGPCDIYAQDGGPCVAAHSTVRALYAGYGGRLYQVKKADGTTLDISALSPGGLANAAAQDAFCGAEPCTISIIYDQTGNGNDLTKAPAGQAKATPDNEANANAVPTMLGANKVYGVHIAPGIGYRSNAAVGTAKGDDPETEYMVVAGDTYNAGCCMDYGNMETTNQDDGEGAMEAIYFGACTLWGRGGGTGPWVMAELENGLWPANLTPYDNNISVKGWRFVTGMVKGGAAGANRWTIKNGSATGGPLMTPFDGPRPNAHYNPMRKQGAVGLGISGDNSDAALGDWFEGIMTAAYASPLADDAVQANIVSVYGQH